MVGAITALTAESVGKSTASWSLQHEENI